MGVDQNQATRGPQVLVFGSIYPFWGHPIFDPQPNTGKQLLAADPPGSETLPRPLCRPARPRRRLHSSQRRAVKS